MPDPGDSSRSLAPAQNRPDWLTVDIVVSCPDWDAFDCLNDLAMQASLGLSRHARFRGQNSAEACVAFSDDASVRQLNAQYRGVDKATNVLSFPQAEQMPGPVAVPRGLGDIVLAYETVAREASEQNIDPDGHVQHLIVHGLLHLLGFGHEDPADANDMETLEIEILASLGIPNPYLSPLDVPVAANQNSAT
jgi:probable rRNA maturation factor